MSDVQACYLQHFFIVRVFYRELSFDDLPPTANGHLPAQKCLPNQAQSLDIEPCRYAMLLHSPTATPRTDFACDSVCEPITERSERSDYSDTSPRIAGNAFASKALHSIPFSSGTTPSYAGE